jgi:4-hydroxy-3-methylbut-2-enyl diphosphate reductase
LGKGNGHYLVVLDLKEAARVGEFLAGRVGKDEFLTEFAGRFSEGFDPDKHLARIGVANQTTMLREETEAVQRLLRDAVIARDGNDANFRLFDTICGATQERQDALRELLSEPLDLLLVVGGYNSSNTTHLAEMGEQKGIPTWFVRNQECLESPELIRHFDLHRKEEVTTSRNWLPPAGEQSRIGITAGASCPNNLIEQVLLRVLKLRGEALPVFQA